MPTPLCQRLGIEMPVFAFSHCRDVVAAVSKAGGLGMLGAGSMGPEQLAQDLDWLDQECGDAPYGVDLMFPAKSKGSDPVELQALIPQGHLDYMAELQAELEIPPRRDPDEPTHLGGMPTEMDHLISKGNAWALWEVAKKHRKITLLASALGPPPAEVRAEATELGLLIAGLVGDPKHVKHHVAAGVDVLIAQGHEAAGHTGSVTTMVLVPQVVATAGDLPVIAAGGIATGGQIVAALAMGAQAVWTGSVWLATAESDVDPLVKAKIVAGSAHDTDKFLTVTGKSTRHLKTSLTDGWARPGAPAPLESPLQQLLLKDAVVGAFEHHVVPAMGSAAGQAISLVTAQRSVASVMDQFRTGMADAIERISSLGA